MAKKKNKPKISLVMIADYWKTTKPTDLSISRNGLKFTIKWGLSDKDHKGGQQVEYRTHDGNSWGSWTSVSGVAVADRSKVVELSASNYFPTSGKPIITSIAFRVRGKVSKSAHETKSLKYKTIQWSDWVEVKMAIQRPAAPSLSAAWGGSEDPYATNFTVGATSKADDDKPYSSCEWQSILVPKCNETDGKKLTWSSVSSGSFTETSKTIRIEETSGTIVGANLTHTRWFRVRTRGIGGTSDWTAVDTKYAKHVYATPQTATILKTDYNTSETVPAVTVEWNAPSDNAHPIDKVDCQYLIATPATGFVCPTSTSWVTAATPKDTKNNDKARFHVTTAIQADECMWARIMLTHDDNHSYSAPMLVKKGSLAAPTQLSVTPGSNNTAAVAATNNSSVPDADLAIVYRQASNPSTDMVVGVITHGTSPSTVTVKVPSLTNVSFGVYAFQGTASAKTRSDGVTQYSIRANMTSSTLWDGGSVPSAPTSITVNPSETQGEVVVTWKWAWSEADITEISWSQNPNAWESSDEPERYEVTNIHDAKWRISGLETGVVWYIRLRLGKTSGNEMTWGPYSDNYAVDLASAPAIPVLVLSDGVITEDGSVTATWAYVSGDGTGQSLAEICQATVTTSGITYGTVIAHTETAQKIVINAKDAGWLAGNTYYLCVRVVSRSGRQSDGWSAPVPVIIANPLTCTISSTSLETVTVDDDEDITRSVLSLTEMPLSVTVTGAGDNGTTIVAVERSRDFAALRPDDTTFYGYAGETIALVSRTGAGSVTIATADLIGAFDDEAHYRIVATVQDGLGQSASASLDFEVHWDHQAIMPEASALVDPEEYVAFITPTEPDGAETGDTCDIYRLSADKPELIVQGAEWGTTYVDPYPTLGSFGGHRVVFRTVDGDYKTETNEMAWIDLGEDENDLLDVQKTIIDFPGGRAMLDYNMTLSSAWQKDFKETKYLGGAVQGDWNQSVSRTTKVDGILIIEDDPEQIQIFRRLAVYPGICHVRTPEGSSFAADVQVTEKITHADGGQKAAFTLSITRVDPESLDGVPYEDWNPEEEEED